MYKRQQLDLGHCGLYDVVFPLALSLRHHFANHLERIRWFSLGNGGGIGSLGRGLLGLYAGEPNSQIIRMVINIGL